MLVILLFSQIGYRLVKFDYNSSGCLTCHLTPILKMDDTTYILGSLHYNNGYLRPMLMALKVKKAIDVLWYRAFASNPDLHLDVSALAKVNDSLIVVGGGHGDPGVCTSCSFVGLFNIKTQNFVWAKYFSNKGTVRGLAIDGDYIVAAIAGTQVSSYGAVVKLNMNGSLIWGKEINFGYLYNDAFYVIPEGGNYLVMGARVEPVLFRLSADGNTATLFKHVNNGRTYKFIKDCEGNYVMTGSDIVNYVSYLSKIDPAGNVVYSKRYSSNDDFRLLDITLDLDCNYLVAGHVKIGSVVYPVAAKIDKNNGNLMWARYWLGAPNQAHNEARGIIATDTNKILISGYLGTAVDNHNGFVAVLDSMDCLTSLNVNVSDYALPIWSTSINLYNYSSINNLTLIPYSFSLTSSQSCQVTPLSDNEYKNCYFSVYAGRGFIGISSEKELRVEIYNIKGEKIWETLMKEGRVYLDNGIYIIKVEGKRIKLVVRR